MGHAMTAHSSNCCIAIFSSISRAKAGWSCAHDAHFSSLALTRAHTFHGKVESHRIFNTIFFFLRGQNFERFWGTQKFCTFWGTLETNIFSKFPSLLLIVSFQLYICSLRSGFYMEPHLFLFFFNLEK